MRLKEKEVSEDGVMESNARLVVLLKVNASERPHGMKRVPVKSTVTTPLASVADAAVSVGMKKGEEICDGSSENVQVVEAIQSDVVGST